MEINKNKKLENLKARIEILTRGIKPPIFEGKKLDKLYSIGVGAGPQGKMYKILSINGNNESSSMISSPVFLESHHLSKYALNTTLGEMPGTLITENNIVLKSTLPPKFLSKKLADNTLIFNAGLAMMHCYNTCTSVFGYKCQHFGDNEGCSYCEIDPIAKKVIGLSDKNSIDKIAEAIQIAVEYDNIRTLTITTGTFDTPDNVALEYLKLLKEIKRRVNISIHFQMEPIDNLSIFKELSNYADSVGIFLEIFNEDIRKKICPGKSKISLEKYIENWTEAVKYFGRGNVMTTCLLGFGVEYDEILKKVADFAKIGVRTIFLFVRCKSEKLKDYTPTYLDKAINEIIDLHLTSVSIMKENGILFAKGVGSGCIGCQGCTAMMEAGEIIEDSKI